MCVMEYYSAMKKGESLPFVRTWINLEGIMLSEKSQRKTNTVSFYLHVDYNTLTNGQTKQTGS